MIVDARLESARHRFPEISFKDFDISQTGIDRWSFTDRDTGVEYRRVEHDPLLGDGRTDIAAFTVDAGGRSTSCAGEGRGGSRERLMAENSSGARLLA